MISKSNRNLAIFDARLSGKTYSQIAKDHKISTERARGIVWKYRAKALAVDEYGRKVSELAQVIEKLVAENKSLVSVATGGFSVKVTDLNLSVRSTNSLLMGEIYTVSDILALTDAELLKLPNLGRKSLSEIRSATRSVIA